MLDLPIATLVAVLLIALKAGDLLLSAEQQKGVQRYCDELALRLTYANIGRVYLAFRRKPWQRRVYTFLIVLELAITSRPAYAIMKHDIDRLIGVGNDVLSIVLWISLILAFGLGLWLTWLTARWAWGPTGRVLDWLLGVSRRPIDAHWILWTVALMFAATIPFYPLVSVQPERPAVRVDPHLLTGPVRLPSPESLAEERALSRLAELAALTGIAAIPAKYVAMEVSLFGCLITFVALCHLLLWLGTGLMWRVATYSKGAWAAVIILLTVIFALAELLFRHR